MSSRRRVFPRAAMRLTVGLFLALSGGTVLAGDRGPVPEFTPDDVFIWEDTAGGLGANSANRPFVIGAAANDAIARYGDVFDFLLVFTTFTPSDTPTQRYDGLRNHVLGIGTPDQVGTAQFDRNFSWYGIETERLRGATYMWDLWSHGERSRASSVLGQEYIHSVGIYLGTFPDGVRSFEGDDDSCGRAAHWNYRMDAGGSSMEIREWVGGPATRNGTSPDNPVLVGEDNSFNKDIPGGLYSYPDLYLFGIVTPDEMDTMASELRYMDDDVSATCDTPHLGSISSWGSTDIIQSLDPIFLTPVGDRRPSADKSQKDLSSLVILVHPAGSLPSAEDENRIVDLANTLMENWYLSTLGRSTMRLTLPRDCNANGAEDETDIDGGASADCNRNRVPDECESQADCNGNGLDICEVGPGQNDCNDNDVPDDCEIATGASADSPPNGVPDECEADVLYVDRDAAGGQGHGTSWTDAYVSLQKALGVARSPGSAATEIWVAEGVYRPTADGERWKAFYLIEGVGLYGGFDGTETARDQRDPDVHSTILSGDLAADDGAGFANIADNSLHVVIADGVGPTATLDGFVVRDGYADGVSDDGSGAGLQIYDADPTVRDVTFIDNRAVGDGAGVAMRYDSEPFLDDCLFQDNLADGNGGGVSVSNSTPRIVRSRFRRNTADSGGGLYATGVSAGTQLIDSSFVGNVTTGGNGGGIRLGRGADARLRGVTVVHNFAADGGGGLRLDLDVTPDAINSIFHLNEPDEIEVLSLPANGVSYSRVDDTIAFPGPGNITATNLFVRDPSPGPDGSWDGTDDDFGDLRLSAGSAAIDAGNSNAVPPFATFDLGGNPRREDVTGVTDTGIGGAPVVDMGSRERPGNGTDTDGDGFEDGFDVCPSTFDPDQLDADGDGVGNACDTCTDTDGDGRGNPGFPANTCPVDICPGSNDTVDTDGDGNPDGCDNCPDDNNPAQVDSDGDGVGNVCDNCSIDFNPRQADCNGDGTGDACSGQPGTDVDGDGICYAADNCPNVRNPLQEDCNGDGEGDLCETDLLQRDPDSDGVCTLDDACPLVPQDPNGVDTDLDGADDICDCATTDDTAYGEPEEVVELRFTSDTTLTWRDDAPRFGTGTRYDVMRGGLSELPVGSGANELCDAQGLGTNTIDVPANPSPGQGFYFLVRTTNACADSTWGSASDDTARAYTGCD